MIIKKKLTDAELIIRTKLWTAATMVFSWILNFITNGDDKVSSGASDTVSQAEAKEEYLKNNKKNNKINKNKNNIYTILLFYIILLFKTGCEASQKGAIWMGLFCISQPFFFWAWGQLLIPSFERRCQEGRVYFLYIKIYACTLDAAIPPVLFCFYLNPWMFAVDWCESINYYIAICWEYLTSSLYIC